MAGQGWNKWDNDVFTITMFVSKKVVWKRKPILIQKQANSFIFFILLSHCFAIVIDPQFLICKSKIQKALKTYLAAKLDPLI